MNKQIKIFVIAGALAAMGSTSVIAQDAVRIGTSTTGSVFYTIAVAVSEMVRKHAKLNSTVQPLGGSAANMHGIRANRTDFAMANAYAATSAYRGNGPFKGKKAPVRLVLQGQTSYRGMVVTVGANIKSFKDLAGKKVMASRPPLPTLKLVFNAMAKHHGIKPGAIRNVRATSLGEQEAAQKTGIAAAAVYAFGARAGTIARMFRTGKFQPYYMSKSDRDAALKHLPDLVYGGSLKPGTWPEQKKPWHVFALNAYFTVKASMPAETVYKVAKALLDNPDEFKKFHAAARHWTLARATKNFTVPFHEGSIRYLKEKGVWTADVEARQKKLLAGQ